MILTYQIQHYKCPLSNKPYNIEISGDAITVSSPIELIEEDRYLLFTFKAIKPWFYKRWKKKLTKFSVNENDWNNHLK